MTQTIGSTKVVVNLRNYVHDSPAIANIGPRV